GALGFADDVVTRHLDVVDVGPEHHGTPAEFERGHGVLCPATRGLDVDGLLVGGDDEGGLHFGLFIGWTPRLRHHVSLNRCAFLSGFSSDAQTFTSRARSSGRALRLSALTSECRPGNSPCEPVTSGNTVHPTYAGTAAEKRQSSHQRSDSSNMPASSHVRL